MTELVARTRLTAPARPAIGGLLIIERNAMHLHPYAETFIIRRGSATFTVGTEQVVGKAGQILVVPAETPHKFATGPGGYEAVHIHANPTFETTWLE